ncbi:hypothetical protein GIB67_011346 [Kingdonia uniflora]|uniref:Uncharacterized protein n=1 Tax=Kingdonia uniflora TaxID=39325 RepID=A0A7J7MDC1_9MAGN|nr:hypothetical protein GIB67_011346 [Kingdonia uniflora]
MESTDITSEFVAMATSSKAAIEANKATTEILVQQLSNGTQGAKTVVARELRLLAKNGKENRACITEAGAIRLLRDLPSSQNPLAQENSLNYGGSRVLGLVIEVLRFRITTEARENVATTLFSLSAIHEYNKRISAEDGAVEALAKLLS